VKKLAGGKFLAMTEDICKAFLRIFVFALQISRSKSLHPTQSTVSEYFIKTQ